MDELEKWKPRLDNIMDRSETVLGYFNNHFSGNAPLNALQMLDIMGMMNQRQGTKLDKMLSYMSVEQTRLDDF
jgi:uncharacterized protein YecE (DUF72 family)